jgi:hypothetical protein
MRAIVTPLRGYCRFLLATAGCAALHPRLLKLSRSAAVFRPIRIIEKLLERHSTHDLDDATSRIDARVGILILALGLEVQWKHRESVRIGFLAATSA